MSALTGFASKGKEGRSKFQSLDINSLYRGESLEPSQQKNNAPRKFGMQCLGKVPSARRPPANLPSLKSEHSGNDPAVSLVPSGGTGWGSKPGETTGPAATTSQPHTTPPAANIPVVVPQPPVVAPVMPGAANATSSTANPTAPNQGPPPVMPQTVHSDKLWSSVMASPGDPHPPSFLAHQSPQFQQEFPKLSSGDGQAPATGQKGGSDTQYGPGPSLRPQTEGSWIQGGGRNAGQPPGPMPTGGVSGSHQAPAAAPGPLPHMQPGSDPTGGRSNLGPYVAPAGGMGPGGPVTPVPNTGGTNVLPGVAPSGNMMPPHIAPNAQQQFSRNIMSQLHMYRGQFSPSFQAPMHGPAGPGGPGGPGPVRPTRYQHQAENRFMPRPTPNTVDDELVPRPIIKEEDLCKMDDIARDAGWAVHDDNIDYNKELSFSDDERAPEEEALKDAKASNKDKKRSNDRERENERESIEREEHREDHRDKRNEPLPQRGPPEQTGRNWQTGRPPVNMDFRSPAGHGPSAPPAHPLPHGGPGPAPLDSPIPPVMRPASHQAQGPGPHIAEDDDVWKERRRQQSEEVKLAIERAKQRKEEEEKRFEGAKQGATTKMQTLEPRKKLAGEKDHHDEGSSPGPDWEKDKDRDNRERDRSQTSNEGREEKGAREPREVREHRERDSDFRQISQIGERPVFMREREIRSDRDRDLPRSEREREVPRIERERELPRSERDRDILRSDRDREITPSERDRDSTRNDRDRDLPRNERDRSDREREIVRINLDRDIPRNERDRHNTRNDREIPRSGDREISRNERERDIPRDRDERPRIDRERDTYEREMPRNDREREITRNEREIRIDREIREIPRSVRDRDIPRNERDIPRSERDLPRNERDRDGSRNERDRDVREREITRTERDRERDMRSERDRDRDTRSDRDRKPRDPRDRHDSRFQANIPPRFLRNASGIERSGGFYGGQGSQGVLPPPAVGSGSAQGPSPPTSQGAFPSGSTPNQMFDPRWNTSHFPSGPPSGSGSSSGNIKSGYMLPRSRNADGDTPSSNRERDTDRERNERELDERERDRDRLPNRDIPRERRDRHMNDLPDRYRPNNRERDSRPFSESGNTTRKPAGNYYEGPPEYARSYSRGSQEYDRNEYARGRERDLEIDSRNSEARERDSRIGNREREGRHYDDRRDTDLMDDVYDRHPPSQQAQFEDHKRDVVRDLNRQDSSNDWREKDRKILEDREKLERREGDSRREREERPQRPDSRDSRTSRESRNSRDSLREERSVHDSDHKLSISNREVTGSWVDDHYPDIKEEKKKLDFFREERRDVRHTPGPITREKLEAAELRNDAKRSNLTSLKRSASMNCHEKKQDVRKIDMQASTEKSDRKPNETDVWNRNTISKPLERTTPENTATQYGNTAILQFPEQSSIGKPWTDQLPQEDAVSQNVAVIEDKPSISVDLNKQDVEALNNVPAEAPEKVKTNPKEVEVDVERQEEVKKEEMSGPVEVEPKREKSSRSRSRGARGRDGRASRQGSGSYAVYRGGAMTWGQQRERGRRGLHRPPPTRPSNAGEYTQATESEQSGDEASAESSKEDAASRGTGGQRRPERERESRRPPRSPKQGQKKVEKEEKNRESRRADGEKGFGNSDPHRYDKRSGGYDAVRNSGREGFAPVGEPSRRGRGGAFRRGSGGRRYGPPSSKSPFGQPQEDGKHPGGNDDPKSKNCDGASDPSKEDFGGVVVVDDQPGVALEEERFTFDDADNGFQEVRNKKKEARQKEEQKVQQQQSQQQTQQQPQQQAQPQSQQQQQQQQQAPSQVPQQSQLPSQHQPLPQRTAGGRDKESGGRQKGNKQGSGGGQIPSPIPGSTQQMPQAPVPQAPVPPNMSQGLGGGKLYNDRQRPKLPPRLARQRDRQKQQQHQQQYGAVQNDVSEMNKINQSVSIFPIKDSPNPAPPPAVNAWEKPINAALRPNSPSGNTGSAMQISGTLANTAENCLEVNEQVPSGASSQRSTPSGDKVSGKLGREVAEKTVLDGTSPPVQTIIFENTNYKSGPSELGMKAAKFSNHLKNARIDKGRERKLGEDVEDVQLSFANKNSGPVPEMNKTSDNKTDPIQMPIAFNKNEDSVDMKLDFTFDAELSQLTDDKKNKSMGLPRSMHLPQGVQSSISHGSTDELNFKIASVKKVWEIIPPGPPVIEHNEDGSVASTASSFTPTFGNPVDSGLETSFSKGVDGSNVTGDDGSSLNPGEVVYSYSGNVAVSAVPNMVKNDIPSTSSNVCKVKPQQQAVMSAGPSPIGHPGPLSPPPFNSSNTQQGHINYQPTLGGTAAQFGSISAIPSPPTVLSYSSQQIPSQGGLYGAFQLDGTQVLGGQARSQFSGFPPYGLNQGLAGQTSAFNQQSMYLPTAPHPPPSAAPDIYPSSLSQYRIPTAQGPFGQSQQLSSNPSTVLISSTSNSLMSASVKPSSQQIGAIGTKGGGPYQQSGLPSAPQPSPLFIQYAPDTYISGSQMVQRPGPVQSNVVPTIPHSSSFYSGSAGGQAGYYQATNSTLQQGPSGQPLHQTGSPYGLQGYSTQSGTATPVGLQGFSSPMAQYRGTSLPGHTFLKSGSQHPTDHSAGSNGRTQLKSPSSSQQDVLASVFSSGPQIPSPKSRSSKQQGPQQQQQSPNQQQPSQQNQQQPPHHKFSPYQGMAQAALAFQPNVRGQMNITVRSGVPSATQRYPQPIQRPVTFSGGAQGANTMGGRHRPQHQQPSRQPSNVKPGNNQPYYSHGSNVKMENVSDGKPESAGENKISENVAVTGSNSTAPGSSKPVTSVASQPEHKIPPTENGKEDSAAPAAE